jgi:predicted patatin/cPLA2 family phospholipase
LAFLANIKKSVIFQLAKYLNINTFIFFLALITASFFYLKDLIFKKIERTHIVFDLNTKKFTSTYFFIENGQLINEYKISHTRITSFDNPLKIINKFV